MSNEKTCFRTSPSLCGPGWLSLEHVKRWPDSARLRAMKGRPVRIYSVEHGAFWRGAGAGYADNANASDPLDIGVAIVRTRHCGPEKGIRYVADAALEAASGTL